jgi:hypothetical protein
MGKGRCRPRNCRNTVAHRFGDIRVDVFSQQALVRGERHTTAANRTSGRDRRSGHWVLFWFRRCQFAQKSRLTPSVARASLLSVFHFLDCAIDQQSKLLHPLVTDALCAAVHCRHRAALRATSGGNRISSANDSSLRDHAPVDRIPVAFAQIAGAARHLRVRRIEPPIPGYR